MKVLEEKENFLLNRKEVKVILEAEKNPSYEEAINFLVEKFKTEKDLIVIKSMKGKFGMQSFLITGFIYKTKEDKEKFEPKKKEKKVGEETATIQSPQEK